MKIRWLLLFLTAFSGISACAELTRPALMKDPYLFSGVTRDAVKLAFFRRFGSMQDLAESPRYPVSYGQDGFRPLCNADQIRRINSRMIQQQCWVSYGIPEAETPKSASGERRCEDRNGCIRLSFAPELYDDVEIRELIFATISNPCPVAPPLHAGTFDEYWTGLAFGLRGIRGALNCDNPDGLPYRRAMLKFGERLIYFQPREVSR